MAATALRAAALDETELANLARRELDIENARFELSCSLTLPRELPGDAHDEISQHVDELHRAAKNATALGEAACRMADHLIYRAQRLLDAQRKELRMTADR